MGFLKMFNALTAAIVFAPGVMGAIGLVVGLSGGGEEGLVPLSIACILFTVALLVLFAYAQWKGKKSHETVEVPENKRNRKKRKGIQITREKLIAIWIVVMVVVFLIGSNIKSNNRFDNVFDKDPNSWTESEKNYVNNLFDWIDKQNKD